MLAGRDDLLRDWRLVLNDVAAVGRTRARDLILSGPRGVGKTATVTTFGRLAAERGFEVVNLQAVSGQAGLVDALLHQAESRMQRGAGAWTRAKRAFDRVAGVSIGVVGVSAGVNTRAGTEPGPPRDASALGEALATLAAEVRHDAPDGGVLITIDEMQVATPADLALLAGTLHRLNVDHPEAAVTFAGTGLPNISEALRRAGVTHPDRLFALEPLPLTLPAADATYAIVEPARRGGVAWHPDAAAAVVRVSNGYPAHLQAFAHEVWLEASGPTITPADVAAAVPRAGAQLERRSLGPRWERMADRQMEFLAALALLGGTAAMRDLSSALGRTQQELSWLRQALIEEGDIYAPRRGQLAMAVPLFAPYILERYEEARGQAGVELLSLAAMGSNLDGPGDVIA